MRIFVSSTYEDLKEHRAVAIRALRQLGHEVLAMEDMAASTPPALARVLPMIDRSEAYVGVFAWRYGYVPKNDPPSPAVIGATHGETSITHYEYLRAKERKLPIIAFLLDEQQPWPPQLIDGFETDRPDAPVNAAKIRELRQQLQQAHVIQWFTTPSDLEARVSVAVSVAGLTRQLNLQPATTLAFGSGALNSSERHGIKNSILQAARDQAHALKIDLNMIWWSTRLYLMAALAERLTPSRRILIIQKPSVTPQPELLVGQISTGTILSTIGPKAPALEIFRLKLRSRSASFNDVSGEIDGIIADWKTAFGDVQQEAANEIAAKVDRSPELLQRWFGDAMFQAAIFIEDLQRASVIDLLRLFDYSNEFVPVVTRSSPYRRNIAARGPRGRPG